MKILFITHVSNMAGANRSMFQLIKELKETYGVTPFVLAPISDEKGITIQDALKAIDVCVIETEVRFFKIENPTFRNCVGYIRYLWHNRHLYKKLQDYHFDLIHSNSSVIDIGGYLSRQLGIKHIWHIREFSDLHYNYKSVCGAFYERYTYKHADAFIAISKVLAKHYEKKVPKNSLHTIYNGVYLPENVLQATHSNPGVQFFCAGVICEGKNQKEIVLAIDELVHHRVINAPFHMTMVGIQVQPYSGDLVKFIHNNGLDRYISILPEVDGIQSLAAKMDVGIVSSRSEAFGRVTIEYQMQNLLVIANDSGANPELIQDHITGLLYQEGNYQDLADKMQMVLEHPVLLQEISQKGMEYARTNFSSERNTREIFKLYTKIID